MAIEKSKFLELVSLTIARGEEINQQETRSTRSLNDVRADVRRWDAVNKDLLRSWVGAAQLGAEYEDQFAVLPAASGEIVQDASSLKVAIRERIEFLSAILDRSKIWDIMANPPEENRRAEGLRAFIVHGHDKNLLFETKDFLQNTLGLPTPMVLSQQANSGRTIIEKFEYYSQTVDIAIVLLTADDIGGKVESSLSRRARQNVIFELGYFVGRFGRRSGRVLILHKGDVEIPSDLAGVAYLDVSAGIEAAGEGIRRELEVIDRFDSNLPLLNKTEPDFTQR